MITRLTVVAALAIGVAGCAHKDLGGSIQGGECKVLERPPYAVRGAKPYDQDWIDSTVEGGIGACKWQRPAARPAELDTAAPARSATPAAQKKPGLASRVRKRLWPRSAVAPVPNLPPVEPPPQPEPPAPPPVAEMPHADLPPPPPAPPPAKRSAIDELLHLRAGE